MKKQGSTGGGGATDRLTKPSCLIVCSAVTGGVSAQSFLQTFTLASSAFNLQVASPGGKALDFVGIGETDTRWFQDFQLKPYANPARLESIDGSRYHALLIPHCPGAMTDLANSGYLARILQHFKTEKSDRTFREVLTLMPDGFNSNRVKMASNLSAYISLGPKPTSKTKILCGNVRLRVKKSFEISTWLVLYMLRNFQSDNHLLKFRSIYSVCEGGPDPPEPICAIGHGVTALCCVTNENKSWAFQDYSLTGPSVYELVRQPEFASLPLILEDFAKDSGATFSASEPDAIHIVLDRHLITGQNDNSTMAAVQNLILLCNGRK